MNILFIHQNFPAQFKWLAPFLAKKGHLVKALSISGQSINEITPINYPIKHKNTSGIHPLALEFETKVIRGEACGLAMAELKRTGFYPDLIVTHPGWGESLFAKDVFPNSKLVNYIEFHYGKNSDGDYDPEFRNESLENSFRLRVKNANNLLALDLMDAGISPTHWQLSGVPLEMQKKVKVIFDGIDTNRVKPNADAKLTINLGGDTEPLTLSAGDEIITYVSRNLEPYRGYHSLMRSLPQILSERKNAMVVIVGGDGVSYGAPAPEGQTWKKIFLNEAKDKIDLSRVIFLGKIPYDSYLKLLQVTKVHLYLTYPFVMSWSCIEAMSSGALVVGSNTPPVREFIKDKKNGVLVNFFNYSQIASEVCKALDGGRAYDIMRKNARKTIVEKYDLNTMCLPQQVAFLESLCPQ
jgi:glycosyltransferase involved in cell wall biosynthesis